MATTLTAQITSQVKAAYASTGNLSIPFTGNPLVSFVKNFDSTEVTKTYFNSLSITSSPTSIDLSSFTDCFGNAISMTTVKEIIIYNHDTAIALTVGGGTNGLFATLPFTLTGYTATTGSNGTCLHLTTSITVDGTHKILTLTAGSGTITVDVLVLGS